MYKTNHSHYLFLSTFHLQDAQVPRTVKKRDWGSVTLKRGIRETARFVGTKGIPTELVKMLNCRHWAWQHVNKHVGVRNMTYRNFVVHCLN